MGKLHTEPLLCGIIARAILAHSQCLCIPFRNDKDGLNHTNFVVAELVGMSIPHAPFLPFFALALNCHKGLGCVCLMA